MQFVTWKGYQYLMKMHYCGSLNTKLRQNVYGNQSHININKEIKLGAFPIVIDHIDVILIFKVRFQLEKHSCFYFIKQRMVDNVLTYWKL